MSGENKQCVCGEIDCAILLNNNTYEYIPTEEEEEEIKQTEQAYSDLRERE